MLQNKENLSLSVVKTEERTPDGNLLPDTKERVMKEIAGYLQKVGYINISDISSKLNLSRQTVKKIVDEIIEAWQEKYGNQWFTQIEWYKEILKEIDENPENFDKDRKELIKLKMMIFGKINTLTKMMAKK